MKQKNIGRLISILHRQSQIYINCTLKQFNITSAEYSFLLYLYRKNGVTQEEMSTYLYIDKSATARSIKSLEQKGYIIKNKDEHDKRYNRIFLTKHATEHMEEIRKRVHNWSDFLSDGLDEDSFEIVTTVLEKMVEKVEHTNLKKQMEEV